MSKPPPPPTHRQTLEALLEQSKRKFVPIRKTFLQLGHGRVRDPGPMAALVAKQDESALDQYLLFHAKASGGDWSVAIDAAAWARAMGRDPTDTGLSAVSKAWGRLEKLRLIERSYSARAAGPR